MEINMGYRNEVVNELFYILEQRLSLTYLLRHCTVRLSGPDKS